MKRWGWVGGMLLVSQLTGCASLSLSPGSAEDPMAAWLQQRDYGKALAFVAEAKTSAAPAIGNRQEIEETITTHIASYEQQVVAQAENAAARGDWGTAFELYREALTRLPDSPRLQRGHQHVRQRYAEHLETLELDRLIAKGEWTLKELELSKVAAANNASGWWGQWTVHWKSAGAHDLALELAEHGRRALGRNDLRAARRVLPLALQLSNAGEIPALNTHLQEQLTEDAARSRREEQRRVDTERAAQRLRAHQQRQEEAARVRTEPPQRATAQIPVQPTGADQPRTNDRAASHRSEHEKAERWMPEFRKACREKDFSEAQRLRAQLEKERVATWEFDTLKKQLAREVAVHVQHLTKLGAVHYSHQQYDEALNVWKRAQALDPDNERLSARIKRVTRVKANLRQLRAKSGATQ